MPRTLERWRRTVYKPDLLKVWELLAILLVAGLQAALLLTAACVTL